MDLGEQRRGWRVDPGAGLDQGKAAQGLCGRKSPGSPTFNEEVRAACVWGKRHSPLALSTSEGSPFIPLSADRSLRSRVISAVV